MAEQRLLLRRLLDEWSETLATMVSENGLAAAIAPATSEHQRSEAS